MGRAMTLLKRVLYWQAALWASSGVVLFTVPGWLVEQVLSQPPVGDDVWLRAMGAMAVVLSLLMVLVAHHVDEVWWWAWAFVILEASTAGLFAVNAFLGLPDGAAAWPWWLIGGANAFLGTLEVVALARVGMERSPV
jgi:hypothetical protein